MSLASTQLRLYIDSNRTLFEDKRVIWGQLARKKVRQQYLGEIGQRAFRRVVDKGARAYVSDLGITEKWNRAFPTSDREQTAKTYEREFRERYARGDLDTLLPVKLRPKRRNVKGNPIREGYDVATIRYNIETQREEGKSLPQSMAIALRSARQSYKEQHPGKPLPKLLEKKEPAKKATKKRTKKKATKKRATKKRATKKRATKKRATKKRAKKTARKRKR